MVAPIPSSAATILPLGRVSASAVIPTSGNKSLSFDIYSFIVAINNTSVIAFPYVYSTAMVLSSDFIATTRSFHTIIVSLLNTRQVIFLKLSNTYFLY
jgi:hypothetical protein